MADGRDDVAYDRVVIIESDGVRRPMTKAQYEKMSLRERCMLLMASRVEFYRHTDLVPAKLALRNR